MHDRYAVEHDFLSPDAGREVVTISRLVNAFFRWEFNSCETLVQGDEVLPDRLRQRLPRRRPDLPALLLPLGDEGAGASGRSSALVTGRRPRLDLDTARYFAIADEPDLSYGEKLAEYRKLADAYFDTERYQDFCATSLARARRARAATGSTRPDFDELLVDTVRRDVPGARARPVHRPLPRPAPPLGRDESTRLAAA